MMIFILPLVWINLFGDFEPDWFATIFITAGTVAIALGGSWLYWAGAHIKFNAYSNYIDIIQTGRHTRIPKDEIISVSTTDEPVWEMFGQAGRTGEVVGWKVVVASRVNRGLIIETREKKIVVSTDDPESIAEKLRALYAKS